MARTSVSCCIAEVNSGGEEEGNEESLAGMISGRSGIVLPKSFIAGSFTSDISVGKSVCNSVFLGKNEWKYYEMEYIVVVEVLVTFNLWLMLC